MNRFSADVYAYVTADPNLKPWGSTLALAMLDVIVALLLGVSIRLPGIKITSLSRVLA